MDKNVVLSTEKNAMIFGKVIRPMGFREIDIGAPNKFEKISLLTKLNRTQLTQAS